MRFLGQGDPPAGAGLSCFAPSPGIPGLGPSGFHPCRADDQRLPYALYGSPQPPSHGPLWRAPETVGWRPPWTDITVWAGRSFVGVYRVAESEDSATRSLVRGTTNHGGQWMPGGGVVKPTTCYGWLVWCIRTTKRNAVRSQSVCGVPPFSGSVDGTATSLHGGAAGRSMCAGSCMDHERDWERLVVCLFEISARARPSNGRRSSSNTPRAAVGPHDGKRRG